MIVVHVLALLLGLFAAMTSVGLFAAGIMPRASAPWYAQYAWAAFCGVVAFLLIPYAFGVVLVAR
jgi:hypothetical protein